MAWWTVSNALYEDCFSADCHYRSRINKAALRHYMNFFDFSNLRLDQAFRFVILY